MGRSSSGQLWYLEGSVGFLGGAEAEALDLKNETIKFFNEIFYYCENFKKCKKT